LPKEKHAGLLQTYRRKTAEEIQRAIRSYERRVTLHRQKLADPERSVQTWSRLTDQEQQGLIVKWQKDLARNQELAQLMRDLLREREQANR
jgi:phage baseplate assembly protein W